MVWKFHTSHLTGTNHPLVPPQFEFQFSLVRSSLFWWIYAGIDINIIFTFPSWTNKELIPSQQVAFMPQVDWMNPMRHRGRPLRLLLSSSLFCPRLFLQFIFPVVLQLFDLFLLLLFFMLCFVLAFSFMSPSMWLVLEMTKESWKL